MGFSADLDANDIPSGPVLFRVIRAIVFSPSARFIVLFRFSQYLFFSGCIFKVLGKMLWNFLVVISGCHVSLLAKIGYGIKFPHPVGIVIGEGVKIGDHCTIYQNVTLGKKRVDIDGYPELADNVVLYVGAVVIGQIAVHKGASIGAYAVVTRDVSPNATVVGAPAKPI